MLAEDPSVDAIVAIFIPPLVTQAQDVAGAIRDAAAATRAAGKPLLAVWMAQDDADLAALAGGSEGVPAYGTPEEAVRALAHASGYAHWRTRSRREPGGPRRRRRRRRRGRHRPGARRGGGWLVPDRVAELLAAYGIPQARATVAATRRRRRRGGPPNAGGRRDQGDRSGPAAQVRRRRRAARRARQRGRGTRGP